MKVSLNTKIFRIAAVVIGCIPFLAGALLFADAIRAGQTNEKVNGEVLQILQKTCKAKSCYAPVIQYRTLDGKTHVFRSDIYSRKNSYQIGQRIAMLYDPTQPNHARINKPTELFGLPALMSSIGLVFILVGVFVKDGWNVNL